MAPFLLAKVDAASTTESKLPSSSEALDDSHTPSATSSSPSVVRRLGRGRLASGRHVSSWKSSAPASSALNDSVTSSSDDAATVATTTTTVGGRSPSPPPLPLRMLNTTPASTSSTPPLARSLSLRGSSSMRLRRFSSCQLSPEDFQLEQMLSLLSDDELELAARTNYRYYTCSRKSSNGFVATEGGGGGEEGDLERGALSARDCARNMARRYLRSNRDKDPVAAAHKMKATLQFRRDMDVDGLRQAFSDPQSPYKERLWHHLSSSPVTYVQGYDRDGRSTFVFEPHRVTNHDDEWTLKQHVYTLERAIACSKAPDQTVNAVVNFKGFSVRHHAPPTHIGQQFLTTLRHHYTGHVHRIVIVDAPLTFWCLWTLFQPFIGRKTKHKIQFVSSEVQKRRVLGELYEPNQATPWMLPDGTKTREWNAKEYLLDTPFDRAFDE